MKLIPFEPCHLKEFIDYAGQDALVLAAKDRDLKDIAGRGIAFTGIVQNAHGQRIVGCGGLLEANPFRATAWAVFQSGNPKDFVAIDRAVRRGLRDCTYKLIEAYVDPEAQSAMRWVRLLGFELVRPYRPFFFPDGRGASEWALYKGE